MANTLEGLLRSVGARPVGKGEWLFQACFRCGGFETMYFNLEKMKGICHKCVQPFGIRDVARELAGIPVSQIKDYVEDYVVEARRQMGFEEAMLDLLLPERAREMPAVMEVSLPPGFRTLEDGVSSVTGRKALAYMTNRNFHELVLFDNKFGYCDDGPYAGRVIIPFYENGSLVYWQARDFTGMAEPRDKIKNPPAGTTLHGKSDVLFNYDTARKCKSVIITESWGSSLAIGPCSTALNGKSMSEVQFIKLLAMDARTFIVMLDPGTEQQAWEIAKRLSSTGRYALVASLKDGDPAEVPRSVLYDSVRKATAYTGADHLKQVMLSCWK